MNILLRGVNQAKSGKGKSFKVPECERISKKLNNLSKRYDKL
jgi:hypothetical protein